ncbi:MAG TPA: DUF3501 family protein [Gammaproteobacteria bacterium]
MSPLSHKDLFSLEEYARVRPEYRARVIEHKKDRRIALGEHATLFFEDAMTMQYQVQEMLRLERTFEPELIQDELDVYNPLIPDGSNWKATFMIEFPDENERRDALTRLIGIEKAVWMQIADFARIHPIANEDLPRETEGKTSAVHFLRFELTPEMINAVKTGAAIRAGIDHPQYQAEVTLPAGLRDSLTGDLK